MSPGERDPRGELSQVLHSLVEHLPGQLEVLLGHPRFAQGKAALDRLSERGTIDAAVAEMEPAEAAWLAAAFVERWGAVGSVVLEPHASIRAPTELWLAKRPARAEVHLELADCDLIDVQWDGVMPGSPGLRAVVEIDPPEGDEPATHVVRARVQARAESGRVVLRAGVVIRVRVPRVVIAEDGMQLVVCDQCGQPGEGVLVELGEREMTSGIGGLVELEEPLEVGGRIRVAGVVVRD